MSHTLSLLIVFGDKIEIHLIILWLHHVYMASLYLHLFTLFYFDFSTEALKSFSIALFKYSNTLCKSVSASYDCIFHKYEHLRAMPDCKLQQHELEGSYWMIQYIQIYINSLAMTFDTRAFIQRLTWVKSIFVSMGVW